MLVHLLGVIGIALNIAFAWPQVWRARRDTAGIAEGTILAGLFARLVWSVYAVLVADVDLFWGQAPVALGFAVIGLLVARDRRSRRGRLLLAMAGCALAAWAIALTPLLPIVAIVAAALVNLPQMVRVLRDPAAASGVSAAMYWLVATASAVWLAYGIVAGNLTITAPHLVLLPTAVATAIGVARARATDAPRAPR